MTLNECDLRRWEADNHILLTGEQKAIVLDTFSTEPESGFAWSAQDIAESIRRIRQAHPAPERPLPDFLQKEG